MQITPDNNEWYAWFVKSYAWIISGLVGIAGKICYELMQKRKLSLMQWIGVGGLSAFVGYLTAVWCVYNDMKEQGYIIVPVSTLLGEKIIVFVTAKHKYILNAVFNVVMKKK